MRHKSCFIYISIGLLVLLGGFIFERVTLPETTPTMVANADRYAATHPLGQPANTFSQDGCSLWFDTLLWHDFRDACLVHDIVYWVGGTSEERKAADVALKEAIAHTGPLGPVFSYPVYSAVRIFGNSFLTRAVDANWGYGWNQ